MTDWQRFRGVVVTVGTQSDQIKFSLSHMNPEYIAFIATETEGCLKQVEQLKAQQALPQSHYRIYATRDTPTEIGQVVENCVDAIHWLLDQGIQKTQIAVDPTGGRKWMAGGAIMAAQHLGLSMPYVYAERMKVPNAHNGTRHKADPRTMELVELGEAYEHLALPDLQFGITHYNQGHYAVAADIFGRMPGADLVMQGLSRALSDTAHLAADLDRFVHFKEDLTTRTESVIGQLRTCSCSPAYLHPLGKTADAFENLLPRIQSAHGSKADRETAPWFLVAAERRVQRGDLHGATLLYYRCLELAAQIWLADQGFNPSKPDWDSLDPDVRERFEKQCGQQRRVGMVNCYVLLGLMGIEDVQDFVRTSHNPKLGIDECMPHFWDDVDVRNQMPLEHGFEPVTSPDQLRSLISWTERIMRAVTGVKEKEMRKQYAIPELSPLGTR